MFKKKLTRFMCVALSGIACLSLVACGGDNDSIGTDSGNKPNKSNILVVENGLETVKSSGTGLKYYSSDESFDAFINDYYSRHIRDNSEKSIGTVKQGGAGSRMFQKESEARFISFYNSTSANVNGYDPSYNLKSTLDAYYVTQYGSVMDSAYIRNNKATGLDGAGELGWPFVPGSWTYEVYSVEFNGENTQGWTMNGQADVGNVKDGYWKHDFAGNTDEKIVYESPIIPDAFKSLKYAPLIEIGLGIKNKNGSGGIYPDIKDIVASWQLEGDDNWYSMSYYEDAMYNKEINGNGMIRAWYPAYLHPSWGKDKNISKMKVELIPKDGKKLDLSLEINYFRLQTDTRLTNNNAWYINAMEEYISYTGDFELLERNFDDIRKAAMFEIYALGGKDGLVKTDYIWGKTTTYVAPYKYGLQGNGWYDCMPTGTVNMQANVEFYNSLLAMAKLEELAEAKGIVKDTKIRNPHPYADGAEDIAWTYTANDLRKLAETVKNNIRKDVKDGGLWNPATGRFAWAIYDENTQEFRRDEFGDVLKGGDSSMIVEGGRKGEAMDYGHTEFNLYAVANGIASAEQAKSIMSWINGERTIAGDDSTGEDIYMYEFAPRVNTKSNVYDNVSIHVNGKFGTDIQNGGVSMHIAYYDLLARKAYKGNDDSFARFKKIQAWYEKVQAAGGEGSAFYNMYYSNLLAEGGGAKWRLSGNGQVGAVGLDAEFYESALLYATIPSLYFGLDSVKYNELTVVPDLPSSLEYMAMQNLRFYGAEYDLYVSENKVVISGVDGGDGTQKVNVTLKAQEGKKVYVNGKERTDFVTNDGKITIQVNLGHCVVEIK